MSIHLYLLLEKSATHLSNLMNLRKLYLSLSTAGVREAPSLQRFDTFFTIKKIWH